MGVLNIKEALRGGGGLRKTLKSDHRIGKRHWQQASCCPTRIQEPQMNDFGEYLVGPLT